MEEMHRKLIGDLQQKHQKEVAALLKEKDQVLREETSATMAGKGLLGRNHTKIKTICVGEFLQKL